MTATYNFPSLIIDKLREAAISIGCSEKAFLPAREVAVKLRPGTSLALPSYPGVLFDLNSSIKVDEEGYWGYGEVTEDSVPIYRNCHVVSVATQLIEVALITMSGPGVTGARASADDLIAAFVEAIPMGFRVGPGFRVELRPQAGMNSALPGLTSGMVTRTIMVAARYPYRYRVFEDEELESFVFTTD